MSASANAEMNRLILAGARRNRSSGLIDRLTGVGKLTNDRQTAFSDAVAAFEHAARAGDEIGKEMADARIEAVLAEARQARSQAAASNVGRTAEPPAPSFDGGVRRPVRRAEPPNMNRTLRQAVAERRAVASWARESV